MLLNEDTGSVHVFLEGGTLYRRSGRVLDRIVPWGPDAGAWRRAERADWQPFEPEVDVAFLERLATEGSGKTFLWGPHRRRVQVASFLVGLWPATARDAVRPLPERHWRLLEFLNRGGEPALQLLQSNPALAFLAATTDLGGGLPGWLRRRRRDLAARCGFAPSEQSVGLLRKLSPECAAPGPLAEFRDALDPDTARWFAHLPRINPVLLAIGRDAELRARFSPACLARLARMKPSAAQAEIAVRIRELADRFRSGRAPLPFIRGLSDIDTAFRGADASPRETPAPVPPAAPPPMPGIEPIATRAGLAAEGRAMHHCVGGADYARKVEQGRLLIYRMTQPERLTVSIRPIPGGWAISEVKARWNAEPQPATMALIRRWLGLPQPFQPPPPAPARPAFGLARTLRAPRRRAHPDQMTFDFAAVPRY